MKFEKQIREYAERPRRVCSRLRPSMRAAPAAAPSVPMVAVVWKP